MALMHVDGYLLAARIDYGNFSEADVAVVKAQVERYEALFGHPPPWGAGDKLYGNRAVRDYLDGKGIKMSLRPLGRPAQTRTARRSGRMKVDGFKKLFQQGLQYGGGRTRIGTRSRAANGARGSKQHAVPLQNMAGTRPGILTWEPVPGWAPLTPRVTPDA
ncbi:MAG: hypothetical protein ABIF71_04455 [Planctomycetota bacterium]